VAGLGWYLCSRLQPDSIEKSQAPDDGCINVPKHVEHRRI